MAVNLSPVGGVAGQFFDNNGDPLVGGKLFTYAAGTTTPQVTYTSSSGATPNSNPIILNAGGRVPAEIWLTDGLVYKFVLYSSTDQLIGSWDNIVGINSNFVNFVTSEEVQTATAGQTVFTLTTMSYQPGINNLVVYVDGVNQVEGGSYSFVETNSTTVTFTSGLHLGAVVKFVSAETVTTVGSNAAQVAYEPAGSGAVTTTVQAKLRETVSVKDFGAVGDGITDDYDAFNTAINGVVAGSANQRVIRLEHQKIYYLSQPLIISQSVRIEGNHARIRYPYTGTGIQVGTTGTRVYKAHIENLAFSPTAGGSVTTINGIPYLTQGTALRLENVGNCTFKGIQIYNSKYGIYAGNTYGVICYFDDLFIQNCEYGLYGSWGSRSNGFNVSSIFNSSIFFCKRGIEILGGTGLNVDTVALQLCVERGAYFKDVGPLRLNNIYTESIGDGASSSTSVALEIEDCGMVDINTSTLTAIQNNGNHPKYCLNLISCDYVSVRNTYLSYGMDAHIHVDSDCGRVELSNCKGVVNGAGEQVRVIDDTIQGVVSSEVSQSAYPKIYFPSAASLVNYIVAPTDFTDVSWNLGTYTTVNALANTGPSGGQVDEISFTTTVASTSINTTTTSVTGSGTTKIRLRFWAKLVSIDTPVSGLGNFRIVVASTSPGVIVEEITIPMSKEWAFYDLVVDQFTQADGTTPVAISGDQPFNVYIASELLGDAITIAVEGVQVSLATDFYYSGP